MIRLLNVKTLLLISTFFFTSEAKEIVKWSILPDFDCGYYQVTGKVLFDKNKDIIISLRHGSASPYSLILLGGSEKELRVNRWVSAIIYVPRKIKEISRPYVYLQKFVSLKMQDQSIYKLKKMSCGLKF